MFEYYVWFLRVRFIRNSLVLGNVGRGCVKIKGIKFCKIVYGESGLKFFLNFVEDSV